MKALISHGFDKDFLLDNSDRSYAVSCARGACFRFPLLVPSAVSLSAPSLSKSRTTSMFPRCSVPAVSCARGACFRFPLLVPSAVQMNKSLQLETKAGLYEVLM